MKNAGGGAFRVIFDKGKTGSIGNSGPVLKHPIARVRLRGRDQQLVSPNVAREADPISNDVAEELRPHRSVYSSGPGGRAGSKPKTSMGKSARRHREAPSTSEGVRLPGQFARVKSLSFPLR